MQSVNRNSERKSIQLEADDGTTLLLRKGDFGIYFTASGYDGRGHFFQSVYGKLTADEAEAFGV